MRVLAVLPRRSYIYIYIAFGAFLLFPPLAIAAFGGHEGYFSLAIIPYAGKNQMAPPQRAAQETNQKIPLWIIKIHA